MLMFSIALHLTETAFLIYSGALIPLEWLAKHALGASCLCLPARMTGHASMPSFLHGWWESKLSSLSNKHFTIE